MTTDHAGAPPTPGRNASSARNAGA
jgi:hypothetical protein